MKMQVGPQLVLMVGSALLLTACTSEQPGDAATQDRVSPFSAVRAAVTNNGQYEANSSVDDHRRVEDLVAQCMAEQGFDYVPDPYLDVPDDAAPVLDDSAAEGLEPGTVPFAEKYGYQISYGELHRDPEEVLEPAQDTNSEIVADMSPAEQQEYYIALHGSSHLWTAEQWDDYYAQVNDLGIWVGEGDDPAAADPGCIQASWNEISDPAEWQQLQNDPDYLEYQTLELRLQQNYAAEPRVQELTALWSDCMAGAGFEFSDPLAARVELHSEWTEVESVRWEKLNTVDWEAADADQHWAAIYDEPLPGLAEFSEKEFQTAIADAKCSTDLQLAAKQQEVLFELEQRFYQDNQALLDDLVERYHN